MTSGEEKGWPCADNYNRSNVGEKLEAYKRMDNLVPPVRFNLRLTRYYTYDQDAEIMPLCADFSEVSMDESTLFQDASAKEWDFERPLVETQNLR